MTSPSPDPEAGRLESWKQIAAYLDKSERTVRRWQQTEGLPVHKHQHQAKGSVWAYQREIDEWLAARRVSPEPLLEEPPAPLPPKSTVWTAALLTTLLLSSIGGLIYLSRNPSQPVILASTPFTSLPGGEFGPTVSPDGTQVAFFWARPQNNQMGIYLKRFDEQEPVPLDTGNGFAFSPAWSPDGKTIAFLRRTKEDGTWLCLVSATGGPSRNLIRLTQRAAFFGSSRHVAWGPDGRWLLAPMEQPNGEQGIYTISLEGDHRLLTNPQPAHSPTIAPDGQSFAYVREGGSPNGVFEIVQRKLTPQGESPGESLTILQGQGMPAGFDWAPGGRELVLCLPAIHPAHGDNSRLYRLALQSGAQPELLPIPKDCSTVTVSRGQKSSTLLFGASQESRGSLWQASRENLDQSQEFAPSSRLDEYPSFSPDGKSIAFISNRSGQREVWLTGPEGTSPRRITEGVLAESRPDWSPDGSRLVFGSAALQPKGLMIVPIAGGSAQQVPLEGQVGQSPVWSRDGRHIYYSSGSQLWSCRADGSDRKMLRNDGWQLPVGESLDGRDLYVVRLVKQVELALVSLTGGPNRILATLSDRLPDRDVALSPDGLYFAGAEGGLYHLPYAGKALLIHKAFLGTKPFDVHRGLAVSPDGKRILWGLVGRRNVDIEQITGFR